jgi:hypothetical protein
MNVMEHKLKGKQVCRDEASKVWVARSCHSDWWLLNFEKTLKFQHPALHLLHPFIQNKMLCGTNIYKRIKVELL